VLTSSPAEMPVNDMWEIGTGGCRLSPLLYGSRLTSLAEVETVLGPLKPHDIRARGGRSRSLVTGARRRITPAREGRFLLASKSQAYRTRGEVRLSHYLGLERRETVPALLTHTRV
jgi:hypothetical protein